MIEIHLLRYALAAADSGSFSRAADHFRIKQSTLSKHIRFLELRVGLPLFARSTQGVVPTPGGASFLTRARSIVRDLDMLTVESKAMARGDTGMLRIGFQGSLASGDLRAIFDALRCELPGVEVEHVEDNRIPLLERLEQGRLDVAVVAGAIHRPGLQSLTLWSEVLSAVLPQGHRLLEQDRLYWTDLRDMTFLVTSADPGDLIASVITARLSGPSHLPAIVAKAVSRDNLASFATHACVPVMCGPAAACNEVTGRQVHDAFGPTRLDHSVHWHSENANPALAKFLALLSRRYGRPISRCGGA